MIRCLVATVIAGLALAAPALAEVVIRPAQVRFEQTREFRIIVRNTTPVDTVRVEVEVPEQLTIASLGPPPLDWGLRAQTGGVEYRGGAIPPGERLTFVVRAAATAGGPAVWSVDQEYADLRVDRWRPRTRIVGAPPSPVPADPVEPPTGGTDDPDGPRTRTDPVGTDASAGGDGGGGGGPDGGPPVWLGFISILLALGALAAAGFVWARRPPADDARPG